LIRFGGVRARKSISSNSVLATGSGRDVRSVKRSGIGSIFEAGQSSTVPGVIVGCVGERRFGLVDVR
jgi:hypothetical protein